MYYLRNLLERKSSTMNSWTKVKESIFFRKRDLENDSANNRRFVLFALKEHNSPWHQAIKHLYWFGRKF